MKYAEELSAGDCFFYNNSKYLLTCDFRKNGSRLAYSVCNGLSLWIEPNAMVELLPIYYLDKDNNIIPIKLTIKDESLSNIS